VMVLAGDPDSARNCLLQAQHQPGPHVDFVLSLAEQKLAQLSAEG
jgi:hypothetical protein